MYYYISVFMVSSLYISVILLNIYDISMDLFIISPISFHAKNNPDQWYQSRLLLIGFQCMSLMRYKYSKLGPDLVSLEDNLSHTPKKPSMAE